jgi:hypothetical protein
MFLSKSLGLLVLLSLVYRPAASAQQDNSTSQHRANSIYLDVVVAPKSGSLLPVFHREISLSSTTKSLGHLPLSKRWVAARLRLRSS